MADPAVQTFYGTTVAFATTTGLNSLELIDISYQPGDRAYIDVTHYGSGAVGSNSIGNAEKIAGEILDPGSFRMVFHFNPSVEVIGTAPVAENCTITWNGGTTWVFSCAWHPVSGSMPMNDKGTLELHVECLGTITVTDAV